MYVSRDFLKLSNTSVFLAVLYDLVRSVVIFIGLLSCPSDRTDSMLSVLHAAGTVSKRARNAGDAAVLIARL